jgi:hypothetical protein
MMQLTLSMGPARAEVWFFVQRATVPSKRASFLYTPHMLLVECMMLLCCTYVFKNIFSPLQIKNKPHDRESEPVFILGSIDCVVANSSTYVACRWNADNFGMEFVKGVWNADM